MGIKQRRDGVRQIIKSTLAIVICCYGVFIYAMELDNALTDLPDGIEVHNVDSGEANEDGWYPAESITGRFKLSFPTPYSEWSIANPNHEQKTHSLSSTSSEGIKFLIIEFTRTEEDKSKTAKEITKSFLKNKRRRYNRHFIYDSYQGTEIKITSKKSSAIYRFIFTPDYIYQISIEYPKSQKALAKKLSAVFLNSLHLIDNKL